MAIDSSERIQDLLTRNGALREALDECLARLIVFYEDNAHQEIERMRDDLIGKFKNSDIHPERELEHAKIVRPAIEVLQITFDGALDRLKS
jgi:hypothetical protein